MEQSPKQNTPNEQEEIEQKRKAYAVAFEGGGLMGEIKQIISVIRGGKLSEDGQIRMMLDAERENTKHDEKFSKSYLRFNYKQKIVQRPNGLGVMGGVLVKETEEIEGVINGQNVHLKQENPDPRGHDKITYSGNINGKEISSEDAKSIFSTYYDVARTQGLDLKRFREKQELEDKKNREDSEKI